MPSLKKTKHTGIRLYSGASGKTYHVNVRMKGRAYSCHFSKLNDALAWRDNLKAAIRRGEDPMLERVTGPHTLSDEIQLYIDQAEPGSINRDYLRQFKWWQNSEFGSVELRYVDRTLLIKARNSLKKGDGKAPRANSTVNRYLAALSKVLSAAAEDGRMSSRIQFSSKKGQGRNVKLRETNARNRFLKTEEISALISACRSVSEHLYAMVILALSSGARAGELLGLEWRNINLPEGFALAENTKNGEDRVIYFQNDEALNVLDEFNKVRKIDDPRVFGGYHYRGDWQKALRKAGISDFRFHDLRHTAATHMRSTGATAQDIADFLGHKTLAMVKRYSHEPDGHIAAKASAMNKAIFN